MDISLITQKIAQQIRRSNNLLLVIHQQPDADALGSMAAVGRWLDLIGKDYACFCLNQPPANISWLNNFQPLITDEAYLKKSAADTVIVLDSGDLDYAGATRLLAAADNKPFIINIDHHQTNANFGDLNLVVPAAVSTTEIIFKMLRSLAVPIDPKTANALLAGIINDTYNFTNPNTTDSSLEVASRLLAAGASLTKISDSILKNKSLEVLKVWGEILIHLNYNSEFESVSTIILDRPAGEKLADIDLAEGVANFLNSLTGIKIVIILQQREDNVIKGSLRTNDDLIDVSQLAKILGGGGHRKAAGFRLNGELIKNESGHWMIK